MIRPSASSMPPMPRRSRRRWGPGGRVLPSRAHHVSGAGGDRQRVSGQPASWPGDAVTVTSSPYPRGSNLRTPPIRRASTLPTQIELQGAIVVVTSPTHGIGAALAQRFHDGRARGCWPTCSTGEVSHAGSSGRSLWRLTSRPRTATSSDPSRRARHRPDRPVLRQRRARPSASTSTCRRPNGALAIHVNVDAPAGRPAPDRRLARRGSGYFCSTASAPGCSPRSAAPRTASRSRRRWRSPSGCRSPTATAACT